MKNRFKYVTLVFMAAFGLVSCHERYVTYSDAEYIMFADTMAVYPVQKGDSTFVIPVVSTVIKDYDRTVGVEIVDKGSNAIEKKHYRLESNTVTIKAGQNRTDVLVHGYYENIEPEDSLGFELRLVMNDKLEMPLYGSCTKAVLMKSCPFDINSFTGYCVLSSMFLMEYSQKGMNRLVYTRKHPTMKNTIICENWFKDGYDVTMTFNTDDPLQPLVTMEDNQVASDQGSFFGTIYGDFGDKLKVGSSKLRESIFYPCGSYLYVWTEIYVEDFGVVGHFYNVMEWVSDEEAERIKREGF